MKVFLSWSGSTSKLVANELNNWLKYIFPDVELWMSASSIEAGAKWAELLDEQLQDTSFGIICLLPENVKSPWLLFEAGALSKSLNSSNSRVVPFCNGLNPAEVTGPLSQFQGVQANKDGTFSLVKSINSLLDIKRPDDIIKTTFETWWPKLETELAKINVAGNTGPELIKVNNILCGVTTDYVNRGGDKDIAILQENFPGKVTVIQNLSLKTLRNALSSKQYEIVHLVGFVEINTGDFIFNENEKIKPEGLLQLLQSSNTKFVLLATCDSLLLGAALARHMSIISGVGSIQINNIVEWEECFYQLLGQGMSLTKSYDIAQATANAPMMMLVRNDAIYLK